jgi:pimeloyl-ACP methyl ester carboxylesterase
MYPTHARRKRAGVSFLMELQDFAFEGAEGLTLRGSCAGDQAAPTLIYLHGGGQTRHSWEGAMQLALRGGYRVISYDARGHGESEWSLSGNYSTGAMVADLMKLVATIEQPLSLIGASMGGITAMKYCGENNYRSGMALILVDIVPRPAEKGVDEILAFMSASPDGFSSVEEAADAVARYNPNRAQSGSLVNLTRNLRKRGARYYWHWDPKILGFPGKGGREELANELEKLCKSIFVPTLLIRGAKSIVVDDNSVEELRILMPHARVYTIEKAGHMVAGDSNTAFSEGINTFLNEIMPAS